MSRAGEIIDPGQAGCQLYLISPPRIGLDGFASDLDAALVQGGCAAFLLRLEGADQGLLREAAQHLHPVCRKHGIAFLVAGDLALALDLRPDGLHLAAPQEVEAARAALGEAAILGAGCASRHAAMVAGEAGADYIAFGKVAGALEWAQVLELVRWWSELFVLPCLGLGARSLEDCKALKQAGADLVGVADPVWGHAQGPAAGIATLQDVLREA